MCKRIVFLFSLILLLGPAAVSSADLVAYWPMDEGIGGITPDKSGNGLDGTLVGGPSFAAGVFGPAIQLDGSNTQYVDCGTDPAFDITEQLTVAAWIKMDHVTDRQPIVNKEGDEVRGVGYRVEEGGIVHVQLYVQGWTAAADKTDLNSTVNLEADRWYHLAFTYEFVGDGSSITRLYIDGEEHISTDTTVGPLATNTQIQEIGRYVWSGSYQKFFNGLIDDVMIFNHVLSAGEIQGIMNGVGGGFPLASSSDPRDGALHEDTWVTLSWRAGDFAVSHDVYLGDNFDDVNEGTAEMFRGNQTTTFYVAGFPGFAYPDGLVPGTTYYWRIDEVNDTDPNSPWKGDVWSFSVPPKTAYYPVPADAAEQVETDITLSWTGGYGSKLHTVYFGDNFDDVANAVGGLPQGTTTYTPDTLKMAKTYYWRVDEFDIVETHKGDVWSFTVEGAVTSLKPANGAVDVKQTPVLTWVPGIFAASHNVYFGTDADAVKNADTGSPEYKGTRDLGADSYEPGKLEWDCTYYWRIDEVNNTNPDSPWTGILWSFTTANFLIVDDFESYNDIDPPDPQSNRIFEAWADGYDIPTNGALVGNDLPPYAEQTIVHGGNQSMPLYYDNSVGNSEATHTLTYPRDWTEKGVNTLTIWFRGISDNAAETLYVALNGSAVVNHDNPNAAQINKWTQWNIDLQAFADQGVNLANVNTISLGLGNKQNPLAGGSGTMYFDDIRLYPPPPPPAP
jgi:hypothetical protein